MPVACEKLVLLQLEKTASTTIAAILIDLFDGEQIKPKHGPFPDVGTRIVVGSVRNPWDFYVSMWAFGCLRRGGLYMRLVRAQRRHQNSVVRRLPGPVRRNVMNPAKTWERLYANADDPALFRAWLSRIHDPANAALLDARSGPDRRALYGDSALSLIAGYATYRYCQLYVGNMHEVLRAHRPSELARRANEDFLPKVMIRMEHLGSDLIDALKCAGYAVDDALEEEIHRRGPTRLNPTSHHEYTEYYDDEARRIVQERDALIIERHGYTFGADDQGQSIEVR